MLVGGVDVYLDLNFIAPPTVKLQGLPGLLSVDLKNVGVSFADSDSINGKHFAENGDQQGILE